MNCSICLVMLLIRNMVWCEAVTTCFQKCCGIGDKETDTLTSDIPTSFQSTYTVRRISSFGQTIINENGEEKEIGRHASIVTYDGSEVPWSSKPAPVQPGVTFLDLKTQIDKLPTIEESHPKPKPKHRWKKSGGSNKKELSLTDSSKNKSKEEVELKSIKYIGEPRIERYGENKMEGSISHENLFSKCKKSITPDDPLPLSLLSVHSTPLKSHSTPDLARCEQNTIFTNNNSKDSLLNTSQKSKNSQKSQLLKSKTETEAEKIAKQYGLDLSLYTEEALSPLNVSDKPLAALNIQTWAEEPVGTLVLSVNFDILQKLLNVSINALVDLCGEGLQRNHFATIIKLTLIGSKKVIKTSKKIEDSCRPNIDQHFSFLIKDMDFRSMRISIYNAEWLGKHDAMAHGLLSLQHLLDKTTSMQLKLYTQPIFGSEVGLMQIYLSYDGTLLHITVEKIFNFDPKIRKWKLYTKIAYYCQSKKVKERISNLVWSELDESEVNINHSTSFKVDGSGRKHNYIVINLKKVEGQSVFKSDKSLGRVTFGPCFHYEGGKKLTPWGRAIINKEKLCYAFKMYL